MKIVRNYYDESKRVSDESVFNCSCGKLGIRGCFEEGSPENKKTIRGAYINGFCENESINYNERLFGFPLEKQSIVNLPDAQTIKVRASEELLTCWSEKSSDFSYCLDMQQGIVSRSFIYDTKKGKIQLSFERFTSFTRPGLFSIRCRIRSIGYCGLISIESCLDGNVKNYTDTLDPRTASGSGIMLAVKLADFVDSAQADGKIMKVQAETINSHRTISTVVINSVSGVANQIKTEYHKENAALSADYNLVINEGDELILEKYCFYHEIDDGADEIKEVCDAYMTGFSALKQEQSDYMTRFWNSSRVIVDSDYLKQENIDFCLYEMLSAAGQDGLTSIAAKGLSGEGYEGHYFWDCEIYAFPFFNITNPKIARALLEYRYSKLGKAKEHARLMGHTKGALYPWRTITGSECSSYYPSGSAQYHINGDIAKAFEQYWNVTHDYEFLPVICEVLLETARLWMDAGHYNEDRFEIHCVTGPDEYTCVVNNNYYTNAGAANNLRLAAKLVRLLAERPEFADFKKKTAVCFEELESFEKAAGSMYYPYDEKLGIIAQDDSFLSKPMLDLASIPKENHPMLMHYHPLFLSRHQVCKQADAVLADHLFCKLKSSVSKRSFDYYEAVTTHDSSLSKCIFGIVAAKLGDMKRAEKYFVESLSTDIDDNTGNTCDGLHLANMGGCYRMLSFGFAGLNIDETGLSLFPMLPTGIRSCRMPVMYMGRRIIVSMDFDGAEIFCENDTDEIEISIYGEKHVIGSKPVRFRRNPKAVLFDLDGVITDTSVYHYMAWQRIADELGIEFNEEKNEAFKGVSRKTCLELLLGWGNRKVGDVEFEEILVRKNDYYKELLDNINSDSVLPGITEAINSLHAAGIKTALFSVSKNTDAILDRLKIRDVFDVIVSGEDITNSKPHFEGYLLAADRLNVDPRLCVMVEDSIAGIQGAKELSLKTIAIMKENTAQADICIDSTSELKDILNILAKI